MTPSFQAAKYFSEKMGRLHNMVHDNKIPEKNFQDLNNKMNHLSNVALEFAPLPVNLIRSMVSGQDPITGKHLDQYDKVETLTRIGLELGAGQVVSKGNDLFRVLEKIYSGYQTYDNANQSLKSLAEDYKEISGKSESASIQERR